MDTGPTPTATGSQTRHQYSRATMSGSGRAVSVSRASEGGNRKPQGHSGTLTTELDQTARRAGATRMRDGLRPRSFAIGLNVASRTCGAAAAIRLAKAPVSPRNLSVAGRRVAWVENNNGPGSIRELELPN